MCSTRIPKEKLSSVGPRPKISKKNVVKKYYFQNCLDRISAFYFKNPIFLDLVKEYNKFYLV